MPGTLTPIASADMRERLRAAGLRTTSSRLAVLEVVGRGGHWNATEVFEAVRIDLPGTSVQAVYGVLAALQAAQILRKIEPSSGAALYEIHAYDNHHHLVCVECGEIRDVPCAVGEAPCLTASDTHAYDILAADVTFRGICPSCKTLSAHPNEHSTGEVS